MRIRPTLESLATVRSNWLAIGLFDGGSDLPAPIGQGPLADLVRRHQDAKDVSGSVGEVVPILGASAFGVSADAVMVFGLGARAKFGPGPAYAAASALGRKLAAKPRECVAVAVPEAGEASAAVASALTEGLVVATRGPDLRKREPARHPFGELVLVGRPGGPLGDEALADAVRRGEIVGQAVNLARELANLPPAEKPPTRLALRAREVAEAAGCEVDIWDEARIRQERLGGVLGVSAGSAEPPTFVTIRYRHGGDRPTLALVGKGVTFDSGGLSLKPTASMEDMKVDMTGAAVVLAAIQAVARLGLPANLVGYFALTENMTGGKAMKLGDVLTIRNGKTVEVLNTDAEGRLVLADTLCLAIEAKPARVLDLATLTGACVVALGQKVAGLFSNDEAFARAVVAACGQTGERAWRMPLDDDYQDQLKSQVADCKNVGGKWAGAITAAKFLQQFVGETPWVHLDIAGPSWADNENSVRDSGATGCFVRTLVRLVESELNAPPADSAAP